MGFRIAHLLMAARLTEFANEWANKIYLEDEVSVEVNVGASYRCKPFDGDIVCDDGGERGRRGNCEEDN